jgi:tartrate dehydratase alpha subunit/fumarate hydratase class I-like protein
MVSNKKRNVKYDYICANKEAVAEFKKCREADETRTDTLMKLIKTYKESKNRKRPDCSDPGITQTIVENA